MSHSGAASSKGDHYQRRIALHWLVRMISDNSIDYIQAESTGIPGSDSPVDVDDVVVSYHGGKKLFIQAKKSQTNHAVWKIDDSKLVPELKKAKRQLENEPESLVYFYSQTPFGDLKKLSERRPEYLSYKYFYDNAPNTLKTPLAKLAEVLTVSEEEAFEIVFKLKFGPCHTFEDWDDLNLQAIDRVLPNKSVAMRVLETMIGDHEAGLRDSKVTITREDALCKLVEYGIAPTPKRDIKELSKELERASAIGRQWTRDIAGETIDRPELPEIVDLLESGEESILLVDGPGSGKTCLLLDLADHIEQNKNWHLLFIKGDLFSKCESEDDFVKNGLPDDLVGVCARLAEDKKVVIVLDSLDVLSLGRNHTSLKYFLSILDRLSKVSHVSVVAACREFDLNYDPHLRGRKWGRKIPIKALDIDSVVKPLLAKTGGDVSDLPEELLGLLQNPQNLSLYCKISSVRHDAHPKTAWQLYDCFVDEVVRKDVLLGESAIDFLEEQASKMMSERRDSLLYGEIRIPAEMLQRLVSQGILFERAGRYSFAHQTLMENFIVHDVLKRNLSLRDFILSHPPLPFIRPTVRVLFFHLENQDQRKFVRQVREVVSSDEVAMHLKRLVAESLGEVQPGSALWPLVRFLFNQDATLFKRFLWRTSHPDWFLFFEENLFSLIQSQSDESWHKEYIFKIQKWMNAFPDAVVQHWLRIVRDPALADSFRWEITRALIEFAHWKTDGLYEVFSYLVNAEQDEYPLIGGPLSKFIAATGEGDDLLWLLITSKSGSDESDLKKKLLCSKNVFVKDDFLVKRFGKSNLLLENALELFSMICSECRFKYNEGRFLTDFISDSSYRFKLGDERRYSSDFNVFLDCIEYGLISNCRVNSDWWRDRSHSLYLSTEFSVVYFLINACCENPKFNVDLIGKIVTDSEVFKHRRSIGPSLGKLINTAYPFLSVEVHDLNQNCILSLYDDEEKTDDYKNGYKFDLLQWIPSMYRTVEAQKFMDNMLEKNWLPDRKTYSSIRAGRVKSPWPLAEINKLSKEGFFSLLKHFDSHSDNWEEDLDGDLRGGREQLERAVYQGAVNDPTKYMSFVDDIINANVGVKYHCEILSGVVDHLDHRFGNLNLSNSWNPVEPFPDGKEVARLLLDTVHKGGKLWDDPSCVADVVRVVSNVFEDESPLSELTDILIKLDKLNEDDNIDESSRKRTQGHLLQSIVAVLAQNYKVHESGSEVLKDIACHRSIGLNSYSKSYVLSRLPYIIHHDSNLGWIIFDNIFLEIDDDGISFVEAVLYNNYSRNYPKVKEYLDCFVDNHIEGAYESWGRISSLAYLSGHVSWDSLCLHIEQLGKDCATGCAQVFATNIDKKECMEMCDKGLQYLLLKEVVSDDVVNKAARIFEKNTVISDELIYAFLDAVSKTKSRIGVRRFNDWLAQRAAMNPCWAIAPCERLADVCLSKTDSYFYMSGRESLICTLTEILREADESDDEELIERVLNVQDRFLDLGITDIEKIYTDYN